MYLYINSDITHKSPPTHLPIDRSILHAYLCCLSEGNYIDPSTKQLLYYNFIFYVTRLRISPFYLAEVRWKDVEDNFDGHLNKSLFIKKKNWRKHFLCSLQDYKAADLTTATSCLLLWEPQVLISQTSVQISSPCSIGVTPWETCFALDKDWI